jgi:hypothetical protein
MPIGKDSRGRTPAVMSATEHSRLPIMALMSHSHSFVTFFITSLRKTVYGAASRPCLSEYNCPPLLFGVSLVHSFHRPFQPASLHSRTHTISILYIVHPNASNHKICLTTSLYHANVFSVMVDWRVLFGSRTQPRRKRGGTYTR